MSQFLSGECAALFMLGWILGFLLLGALALLSVHVRRSVLGKALLDACDGDYESAARWIENAKVEKQVLTDIIARGIGAMHITVDGKRTRVNPRDVPAKWAKNGDDTQ